MKNLRKAVMALTFPVTSTGAAPPVGAEAAAFTVASPTVNYMTDPLGIDADGVRFGWSMESKRVGESQSAYEIKVTKGGETVWDSGKVESGVSVGIPYGGPTLEDAVRYGWTVTVWDQDGNETTCDEAYFETAVDGDPDWQNAAFIALQEASAAPIFRTEKAINGDVVSARLYITALGVYSAQVNGQPVYRTENGEKVYPFMNPGYGNGDRSIEYETYDVTEQLKGQSAAVVTVTAGTGWNDGVSANGVLGATSGRPAVKAMLVINTDRGTQKITTNTTDWKGTLGGPITGNGVYYGEDYDAGRLAALGDYQNPGYDDSGWIGQAENNGTPYIIKTDIANPKSAKYMRLSVSEIGPAVKEDSETRLRIMEPEALDASGTNHALGAKVTASENVEAPTQWQLSNINDGKEVWNSVLYPHSLVSVPYAGEIRPSRGMSGRIVDEFEQRPVSAQVYSGTKAGSSYPGGEIDVLAEYSGPDMFKDGITLRDGQTMVVNMGQNLTAVPEIKFSAAKGVGLNMKFAEMLNDGSVVGNGATQASGPKGSIYTKSLRNARSEVYYTFAGTGEEVYQPSVSFFGYQYVELKATGGDVTVIGLRSRPLSSVSRQTGFIKTNNQDVNRLFQNALYGQLSNFFTIPTDCPQRDERLAWTGDAQAFARTAMYNFDSAAFLNGYQELLSDNTLKDGFPAAVLALSGYFRHWATGWSDVEVINAYSYYVQTGDVQFLKDNWAAMNAYMNYLQEHERAEDQAPEVHERAFGDWLAFQGSGYSIMADYYYGYVTSLMVEMAAIVGDSAKETQYSEKFQRQKQAYLNTYVSFAGREGLSVLPAPTLENHVMTAEFEPTQAQYLRLSAVGETHSLKVCSSEGGNNGLFMADAGKAGVIEDNSQTALLWMLKLGWYSSDKMRDEALAMLVENIRNENPDSGSVRAQYGKNTLAVGFLGSNVITPVLSDAGRSDVSYDLLLSTEMPSWLFEVRSGATTIWERWNSYDKDKGFGDAEMNSFNHFAYGSVAEWMYRYMAGIESENGFKNIILQPTLDKGNKYNDEERIRSVSGRYDSFYGTVWSDWTADENAALTEYHAVIPANTSATLYLPVPAESVKGFVNIPGISFLGMEQRSGGLKAKFVLKSGGYDFTVTDGKLSAALADGYEAVNLY